MRNGKSRIAAIIICFFICIFGIVYYVTGCDSKEVKADSKVTKVKAIQDSSQKKKHDYEKLRTNINEIEDADDLLYSFTADKFLILNKDKILMKDVKRKTSIIVKAVSNATKIISSAGNDKYISWIEQTEEKQGYQILLKNILYVYDIKKDKVKKIDEGTFVKNTNNIYSNNHDIGANFKLKDSRILYLCYEYNGYKFKDQYIKEYNIDDGSEKILYRQDFKNNNSYLYLYDFDYEKDYLACCIKYYGNSRGYALMLHNGYADNSGKLLAVSEKEIKPTILYPYMSFQVGNDVHLYNMKKKDDDFLYESKGNINGVKMSEEFVFWDSDKIYCYSIKDKRIYIIDDNEYPKKSILSGKALYWKSSNAIRYVELS